MKSKKSIKEDKEFQKKWAVEHNIGTKVCGGLVVRQFAQDEEGNFYVAFALEDVIWNDGKLNK